MRILGMIFSGVLFSFAHVACGAPELGVDNHASPPVMQSHRDAGVPSAPQESAGFFDEGEVVGIDLTFSAAEWGRFVDFRATLQKEYVHCGFAFQGVQFSDAACRSNGRPQGWADEPKPQFVVSFNHWNKSGRFLGLRRVNLESDPSNAMPVRDRVGMWLMRNAGLHTPRVNHARVRKNGLYIGVYMNVEQIDEEFLAHQFEDATGNLYSEGFVLETNQAKSDSQRLWNLNDLVRAEPLQGDHATFFAQLSSLLDVHTMLRLTAAEVVLPTSDNWSNGSANFYYYDDPLSQRFVMLPSELDTSLSSSAPPDADLYMFWGLPNSQNPPNKMLQLVYQNPAWKREFEDNLVELRDGPYSQLPVLLGSVCDQIRQHVATDPSRSGSLLDMDQDCHAMQRDVAIRINYIKSVLSR